MTHETLDQPDAFEQRLHSVLVRDAERAPASTLTADKVRRLNTANPTVLPPRRRHTARWIAIASAAVIVGAGATIAGLAGSGTTRAFASWASSPQSITSADVAGIDRVCGEGHPVIVDRRGHSAYAVYSRNGSWIDCLQTIPGQPPERGLPDGWITRGSLAGVAVPAPSKREPLVLLSAKAPEGNNVKQAPVTWVSGRYSRAVSRITISTASGTVVPTMHAGAYAAWWPGNDGDRDIVRAYDRSGALLSTIDEWNCETTTHLLSPRLHASGQPAEGGCS